MHRPDQRVLSPAEEHTAKLARYEQALDEACGITREGEPTHTAPHPQPRQRFSPVPFESVLRQVMVLPGMVHHLEGIDLDGDGVADITPLAAMGPPPMDPWGRIQWQALQENRQHAVQSALQRRALRKDGNNQTLLAALQANDPYFAEVHGKVNAFVHALPAKVRRSILRALEETPGAYLELYKEMRDMILVSSRLARMSQEPGVERTAGVGSQIQDGVAGGSGTTNTYRPDLQLQGLDEAPQDVQVRRDAEFAELKARCRAGKARKDDLLKYLELSGV